MGEWKWWIFDYGNAAWMVGDWIAINFLGKFIANLADSSATLGMTRKAILRTTGFFRGRGELKTDMDIIDYWDCFLTIVLLYFGPWGDEA